VEFLQSLLEPVNGFVNGVLQEITMLPFSRYFLPISAAEFLMDGFRFRFRNYATLSGNADHWHVDYVIVDDNIDPLNLPIR
jgi:hypothetical protein